VGTSEESLAHCWNVMVSMTGHSCGGCHDQNNNNNNEQVNINQKGKKTRTFPPTHIQRQINIHTCTYARTTHNTRTKRVVRCIQFYARLSYRYARAGSLLCIHKQHAAYTAPNTQTDRHTHTHTPRMPSQNKLPKTQRTANADTSAYTLTPPPSVPHSAHRTCSASAQCRCSL